MVLCNAETILIEVTKIGAATRITAITALAIEMGPVSYTHLTLPTICSV